MFPGAYFGAHYFPAPYFPKVGGSSVIVPDAGVILGDDPGGISLAADPGGFVLMS